MSVVTFKSGVLPISKITPGGMRILSMLDVCARQLHLDLVITCADKDHPQTDPHSRGCAYDVRSHDFRPEIKPVVLQTMMAGLSDGPEDVILPKDGGFVTAKFFGWLEHPGEVTEHFHFQQRNGIAYP